MSTASGRLFAEDVPNYASTTFPDPRPFQKTAHEALRKGFLAGHKNQLIMAPTGAGKSYLGHRIAHEALLKGRRAIFVCDRAALIQQTSETADEYGLAAHGIIKADHWRRDESLPYQIASIQTIMKREFWPKVDVVIIDEAHTQYKAWTEFVQKTDAACIGLSATPFSPGLGKLFTNLINAATMDDLTRQGILVPMIPMTCVRADMTGAATNSRGEWADKAAEERGLEIVGDVVSEWIKHGQGRKTIVFGSTIRHCEEITRQFIEAGVMAAAYTSNTTPTERDALLAEYKKENSAIRVLVSVEALAKGFDVRDVGCVVDCRPLRKSLSTAIQMWGRGLRASEETGKKDCILLDHSGNILRFLEDFEQIYYHGLDALDMGEKLDKTIRDKEDYEPRGCPSCGHKPFASHCVACGFEKQKPALDAAVAGEMQAVMLGKKKLADDRRHLWEQVCTYARAHSAPDKQSGRAWHLFKDITGSAPSTSWKFDATPNVEITRNVQNKIRSMNIAFVKARKAA